MTSELLAVGLAVLAWPVTSRDERRLRALTASGRWGYGRGSSAGPLGVHRGRESPRPRVPRLAVVLPAVVVTASFVGLRCGVGVAIAVVLLPLTTWRLLRSASVRRRRGLRDRALHAALVQVGAELAAGTRPDQAMVAGAEVAGPFAAAFRDLARAIDRAEDLRCALPDTGAGAELRPVAAALDVAVRSGAPVAEVLDRVRHDTADRMTTTRALASAVAGARASAALLGALPVVGVAMGTVLGAAPIALLFGTPIGHALLAAGATFTSVGVLWTDQLTDAAQRAP
jgi:tight adherence protein B